MIHSGEKAPDFSLPDQNGTIHSLAQYKDSWILIYFYPKDDTPGCTKEAQVITEEFPQFQELDITVLGVSIDSVESHKKFVEKYDLPFTLLSDEEKEVVNLYGVWGKKKFMGKEFMGTMRTSFVVDPEGVIAKVYEKVKPAEHAQQVLTDVKELQENAN